MEEVVEGDEEEEEGGGEVRTEEVRPFGFPEVTSVLLSSSSPSDSLSSVCS